MKHKLILLLIFLVSLSSFCFAEDLYFGQEYFFNPPLTNVNYNVSTGFNATSVLTGSSCVNITGGSYEGDYCYNITDFYTNDVILFMDSTELSCYAKVYNPLGNVINIGYYWYSDNNTLIKSGTNQCEPDTTCLVDTLESEEVNGYNGIVCNIGFNSEWFNFSYNETTEPRYLANIGSCDNDLLFAEVVAEDNFNNSDFAVDGWVETTSGTCEEASYLGNNVIRGATGDCIVEQNVAVLNTSSQLAEFGIIPRGSTTDNRVIFFQNATDYTTDYISFEFDMSPYRVRILGEGVCDDGDGTVLSWLNQPNWVEGETQKFAIDLDQDLGIGRFYSNGELIYTDKNPDCYKVYSEFGVRLDLDVNDMEIDFFRYDQIVAYPILDIIYYDEITDQKINATNTYDLKFYDGFGYVEIDGTFIDESKGSICTDVDPTNRTIDLNMSGNFLLSSDGYVTRNINIDETDPTKANNEFIGIQNLYLIPLNDSNTITYTWRTPEYQYIDAEMQIYSCDEFNEKTLIDTVPVSGGEAVANLELYTQLYSYSILYDGVVYTNEDTYSKCHIESTTEISYLIDLFALDLEPVLGLYLVDCAIEAVSDDTVTMQWSSNPYLETEIEACIIGKRSLPTGLTEIYRNCSSAISGTFTRIIPDNNNAYYVTAEITQNDKTRGCGEIISFFDESETSQSFGLTGIFGIVILIMGMLLMFAGEGTKQLGAAGLAVLVAFYIGVLSFPIELVSAIIIFLIAIALIGRYSLKR